MDALGYFSAKYSVNEPHPHPRSTIWSRQQAGVPAGGRADGRTGFRKDVKWAMTHSMRTMGDDIIHSQLYRGSADVLVTAWDLPT